MRAKSTRTRANWDISVEAMRRLIVAALAVAVVGAAAYAIYGFYWTPEQVADQYVLEYGRVTAQSRSDPNWIAYPRTRRVRRGGQRALSSRKIETAVMAKLEINWRSNNGAEP